MAAAIESEYLGVRLQMLELVSMCLGQAALIASAAPDVEPVLPVLRQVAANCSIAGLMQRLRAVEDLRKDLSFNVQPELALDARFTEIIGSSLL